MLVSKRNLIFQGAFSGANCKLTERIRGPGAGKTDGSSLGRGWKFWEFSRVFPKEMGDFCCCQETRCENFDKIAVFWKSSYRLSVRISDPRVVAYRTTFELFSFCFVGSEGKKAMTWVVHGLK